MYIETPYVKYFEGIDYYIENSGNYVLLVAGVDYTIGADITGTVYNKFGYDKMYFRPWGSSGAYQEFPYAIDGVNTLPEYDASANDVDLDAYTNTEGKTVRNRVRENVVSLEFNVPTMMGNEFHGLTSMTKDVWLDCFFFYDVDWQFESKKMYRSATVKYHKYFVDLENPNKNIYTDVNIGFVEE